MNRDPIEKLLFLYLLTNTLTNIIGIYEISLRRIAFDTGIDSEMVKKILERFELDDKIKYDNNWVAIKNFVKHQLNNPKINVGIETLIKEVPEDLFEWVNIDYDRLSHLNTNTNTNLNTNTNIILIADGKSDDFKKVWKDFIEMRNKIKKPMTLRAGEMILSELNKLSNKETEQTDILNQSIMNSWQGVFPLKENYYRKNNKPKMTQEEALEKMEIKE
jgi:hypothetical protein